MSAAFRNLRLGVKLAILGVALCALFVGGLAMFERTYAPIAQRSQDEARAHAVAAAAAEAFQHWTMDDDQSNMYAAVIALRDARQKALAETTYREVLAARRAVDAPLAAVERAIADDTSKRLLERIHRDLAEYDGYTRQMRARAQHGDVVGAIRVVTVDNLAPSNDLPKAFGELEARANLRAGNANHDIAAAAALGRERMIELAVLMLVVTGMLLSAIGLSITRPLRRLTDAAKRLATGDVEVEAGLPPTGHDELGMLSASFRTMVAHQREASLAAESVAAGDLTQACLARSERDRLGHAFETMVAELRTLVGAVADGADRITGGADQLGGAATALDAASGEIAAAITQVAEGADAQRASTADVIREIEQLGAHVDALSAGAHAQESDAAELERAFATLQGNLEATAGDVRAVTSSAQRAARTAREGSEAIAASIASTEHVRASVARGAERLIVLREQSEQVAEMVTVIDGIADQTRLLALNAAIEAARAGEHGRGFGVVAKEIDALAERVADETRKIAERIGAMSRHVDDVGDAMQEGTTTVVRATELGGTARASLDAILDVVGETDAQTRAIERTVSQMGASVGAVGTTTVRVTETAQDAHRAISAVQHGTRAVGDAITRIAGVTSETAAGANRVSGSAIEQAASVTQLSASVAMLGELASALHEAVARFRLEASAPKPAAPPPLAQRARAPIGA